jgi:hypothetical protein
MFYSLRYNLTLHDNYNQRILGFDNAHAVKAKKHGYYGGTIVTYDHVHRSIKDRGIPYEFKDAQQLLTDFLDEVNSILSKLNTGGN